jgi:hypothetical protein
LSGEGKEGLNRSSIWWRDIWKLGGEDEGGGSVLMLAMFLVMGNNFAFGKINGYEWYRFELCFQLYLINHHSKAGLFR